MCVCVCVCDYESRGNGSLGSHMLQRIMKTEEVMVKDLVRMAHCKANNLVVRTQQWTVQLNVVFLFTVFCEFSSRN